MNTRRWREKAVLLSFQKQLAIPEWSLYISEWFDIWNNFFSVGTVVIIMGGLFILFLLGKMADFLTPPKRNRKVVRFHQKSR